MKKKIRNLLATLFNPIAKKLGFIQSKDLISIDNEFNVDLLQSNFFSILKEVGFSPKHIVDIGANHGNWTRNVLKYFPSANYSLFEPQHWLQKSIQDVLDTNQNVQFYALGVGSQNGSFKFTIVDRDDSCSFSHSEEYAIERGFKQLDVPVVTLNDFITQKALATPDLIKIDAEGIDLEVLKGASAFLGKTEIFLVEAGVVSKKNPNSISSVIKFMDESGYRLFDITDLNRPWQVKVLWLVELAFVKKNGVIDQKSFR